MIDPASEHLGFIWAAYAFTALLIAALVAYAIVDRNAQLAALARLERSGVKRRSSATPDPRPTAQGEVTS